MRTGCCKLKLLLSVIRLSYLNYHDTNIQAVFCMCASLCVYSLLFVLHKMTAPLKLPVNNQDGFELEEIQDHVSDGRLLLFTSCLIRLNTSWIKVLLVTTRM